MIQHIVNPIEYTQTLTAMREFTDQRSTDTPDQLWLVEHLPVYTQGQAGKPEHVLNPNKIPVIQSDRGGQVTYHGPGQLVAYPLLNLRRLNLGVRQLVTALENILVAVLADFNIEARNDPNAPGVYVGSAKIASIGLRVRHGCSYHGIALNITNDLSPFYGINPCGYEALKMAKVQDFQPDISFAAVKVRFIKHFIDILGYTTATQTNEAALCPTI